MIKKTFIEQVRSERERERCGGLALNMTFFYPDNQSKSLLKFKDRLDLVSTFFSIISFLISKINFNFDLKSSLFEQQQQRRK